ncbi:MAG TPA: alpha/beta hydrolase [Acidimicrobiales bacterium]|nr:alpha/beta hydrolase [Acidimicrobiales bacterium]
MISDAAKQFHALLEAMPVSETRPTLEEARAVSGGWALATAEPAGVSYEQVDASGVPAEWTIPEGADPDRVLLYLHGGGYSVGSIESHRKLVGHLATAAGVKGLSVEYRLAPEHPFPAGLDDGVMAFSFLLDEGYEAGHIGIGGDSAGGGLALALALALRERGLPAPAGLVLLSPWTDLASTGESLTTNIGKDLLLRQIEEDSPMIGWYAGDNDVKHPLISPLYADFSDFPPFVVHVGGDELLLDDSTRLFERASAAGCDATIEVWPDMQHVFQIAAGNVPESDASVAKLGSWLSQRLQG